MNHIVKEYEEEFSNTCAEITVLCGKLKHSPRAEVSEELIRNLDLLYRDAEETLEQIELETPNLEPGLKEKVRGRCISYRKELERLKSVYITCKREAEERKARIELFSHSSEVGEKETDMLLENMEVLESSGQQLEAGRRLLQETEDIGASVLSDLGNQRETLERSRGRLRDVETGLTRSSTILSTILFRAQQNKLLVYLVALIILIVLLAALYYIITGS
ncbi:vesicle transport through interaction with t-SNAREs homolog 1A-like [Eurytemora carolleeae]|uniref:vesicle transport through interaction with t-SNAREs homolog 1A-like n=1 Tax=Eurytemora carolleeae TaxID=1294199 RepID=UPI000C78698D|nr:vesicle transport through interaction with t-SNAREs homolog 1A-like [Eurytemora carolleeae]|eukprot:XP_023333021.1 vesicle transport through interaction with t-SNAREs homolog 1A-like [Eurytemora affinis]